MTDAAEPAGPAFPVGTVWLEGFDAERHLGRLREWLPRPHVSRWWGDPDRALEDARRRPAGSSAIIVADGAAVGYICWQTLSAEEIGDAGLEGLPEDLVDIDLFIGEPAFLGRGVGPRALRALLDRFRGDPSVATAGVGTALLNERALRAFEKAGFRSFREFLDAGSGACRYLVAEVTSAAGR